MSVKKQKVQLVEIDDPKLLELQEDVNTYRFLEERLRDTIKNSKASFIKKYNLSKKLEITENRLKSAKARMLIYRG